MRDLIERLRSNGALPICPFDKRSPEYWTTPNDKPCKFCGGEPEGPDKCTGADTRVMAQAADRIEALERELSEARALALEEAAKVAENHTELRDIEWWLNATKKEVSADACLSIAAAIRALNVKPEKRGAE